MEEMSMIILMCKEDIWAAKSVKNLACNLLY